MYSLSLFAQLLFELVLFLPQLGVTGVIRVNVVMRETYARNGTKETRITGKLC